MLHVFVHCASPCQHLAFLSHDMLAAGSQQARRSGQIMFCSLKVLLECMHALTGQQSGEHRNADFQMHMLPASTLLIPSCMGKPRERCHYHHCGCEIDMVVHPASAVPMNVKGWTELLERALLSSKSPMAVVPGMRSSNEHADSSSRYVWTTWRCMVSSCQATCQGNGGQG